jgi:hypothetical protein
MAELRCPQAGCNGHLISVRTSYDAEGRWTYGDSTNEWLFDPPNRPSLFLKCSQGHSDEQREWKTLEAYIKQELRFAP